MIQRNESRTDLGLIKVHRNVIASIASIASGEVDGVKCIGGGFKSTVLEFLGQKALAAIKVEINKNEEVKIEIPLVVKYGFNIPDVAGKVQESVRNSLERMTNLSIKDINVNVQSIERG